MDTLLQNLRFALRMLRKSPGFTLAAVLTLALGIGANTAIFSVVNGVLLRPLPYADPEQLVFLWEGTPTFPEASVSYMNLRDYQARNRSFSTLAGYRDDNKDLTGVDTPERLSVRFANASLLPTLGVSPALGRNFQPEEDRKGGAPVVLLEHGFWERRYGKDPTILGKTLTLDGKPHTVVGVLPERFRFDGASDVWLPLEAYPECDTSRGCHPGIYGIGRLKPGVTLAQARVDLEAVGRAMEQEFPENYATWSPRVNALQAELVKEVKGSLVVLFAAVAGVLLIAAINVANLLLARGATRQKELAIRAALGAGRAQLVLQLLVESALVGLLGGVLGLLLALWGVDLLAAARPEAIPEVASFSVDGRVLSFTLALSLGVGLLLGILPALRGSHVHLAGAMKGAEAPTRHGRVKARDVLVVGEVALALVLLVGAGLLLRTFVQLQGLDLGFRDEGLLTLQLTAPQSRYPGEAAMRAFPQRALERLASAPGVKAATIATDVPFVDAPEQSFSVVGRPPANASDLPLGVFFTVGPAYFETLGIPLLQGRYLQATDRLGSPRVVVVDERLAAHFFPDGKVLGQKLDFDGSEAEIVGVVRHVAHYGVGGREPATFQFYASLQQLPEVMVPLERTFIVAVRGEGHTEEAAEALLPTVRRELMALDPDQVLAEITPLSRLVDDSMQGRRFTLGLIGLFALLALVLAGIGIYSVMSYAVAQRKHEMGIRMALGARGADVLRLIVGHGFRLALVGVVAGVFAAWALTRLLGSLLESVSATDPVTFLLVALTLGGVAVLASYLPARRAVKVDPVVSLKAE